MTLPHQDQEMLNHLKAGDLKAFRHFFDHWYPVLYSFAFRRLQDSEACRDLLQDVFFTLWEERGQLNITSSLSGYLHGMVHHACLNYLRSKRSNWEKIKVLWEQMNPDPEGYPMTEDGYDAIFLHETENSLDAGIAKLPEECRRIFLLSRFKGLKTKAIAEMLSLSPRTVETQIYKALLFLKENLPRGR
jgi:RNA polymerase sigma-70 factor (ECF subfamily)